MIVTVRKHTDVLYSNPHYLKYEQEYTTERVKLEVMRDKMVDDLEKRGINPKVGHFPISHCM